MTLALAYIYLAITCHLVVISDNEDRVQELILSTDKELSMLLLTLKSSTKDSWLSDWRFTVYLSVLKYLDDVYDI